MTDLSFIFIFMPIALLVYWICKGNVRKMVLSIINLVFYAGVTTGGFGILVASIIFNLFFLMLISKSNKDFFRKVTLVVGIVISIIPLLYYKYASFGMSIITVFTDTKNIRGLTLLVPLGISFYTFKAISILVDAYRGKSIPSILDVVIYLTFFGQIISGPIARIDDFQAEDCSLTIKEKRHVVEMVSTGVVRFSLGMVKKILIANVLENVVSEVFADIKMVSSYGAPMLWLGTICYSLQLYCDFSGYSDMAIGISNMFGYKCPENFDYPYLSRSISEFWRRWHISLGNWFRDYVYIPLGGTRVAHKYKLFRNLMIVWLLTGLWHGANWTFVIWGITYGIMVFLEKIFNIPSKVPACGKWIYRFVVLFIVNIEWMIFKSQSMAYAWTFLKGMFGFGGYDRTARAVFLLNDYAPFILAAVVCAVPASKCIKWMCNKYNCEMAYLILSRVILGGLVLISVAFLVSGANNPFAYANF